MSTPTQQSRPAKLPAITIPSGLDTPLRNTLESIKEHLEVRGGNRGNPFERAATMRDLQEAVGKPSTARAEPKDEGGSSAQLQSTLRDSVRMETNRLRGEIASGDRALRELISGLSASTSTGDGGLTAGEALAFASAAEYKADLTPPPTPTGFTASSGITNLIVESDPPTYTMGHGHKGCKLYGAVWTSGALPVFGGATVLTEFDGNIDSHATSPATTWHLWLTWVTVDGAESLVPAGGTNGVVTRTGEDVALLLEALTGEITASQLYADLGARIDLIDTPTTGLIAQITGVNSQIGTINATLADIASTPAYSGATTYAADTIVSYLGGLYQAKVSTTGNLPTNLTYWNKVGDYASIGDAVAGHAVILADHGTRITATEGGLTSQGASITAINSSITTLNTNVATKADASALTALTTRVTNAEGVNTSQATSLTTLNSSLTTTNGNVSAAQTAADNANTLAGTKADATALTTTNTNVTNLSGVVTAQGTRVSTLETSVNSGTTGLSTKASISYVDTAKADAISASATSIQQLASTVKSNQGDKLYKTFDGGMSLWTTSRTGTPEAISSATGALVTDDPDFGVCGQAGMTFSSSLGPKDWFHVRAGRTYRLRCRFKIHTLPAEGSSKFNMVIGCHTATGAVASDGSAFGTFTTPLLSNSETYTIEGLFSTTSASGVSPFDVGTVFARPLLRCDSTVNGLVLRVQFMEFEDVTELLEQTAAIQVEAATRASQTGDLYAQYTVKLDVGGKVSGYGLASSSTSSEFAIRADRFYIAPPSGSVVTTDIIPFVVQATATTIGGESVPAGVYINDAYIKNGTITNAKIGDAAIDNAKVASLSASKLTAGSIAVGQYIRSSNYVTGVSGWNVSGSGASEFSGDVLFSGNTRTTRTVNVAGINYPVDHSAWADATTPAASSSVVRGGFIGYSAAATSSWNVGLIGVAPSTTKGIGVVGDGGYAGGFFSSASATGYGLIARNLTAGGYALATNGPSLLQGAVSVTGALTATGNITAYSDTRLKEDLAQIGSALERVRQLTGYTFTRKDTGERQTGLLAQDVQAVMPEAVQDDGKYLSVAYGNLIGLLVEAIKELDRKVNA